MCSSDLLARAVLADDAVRDRVAAERNLLLAADVAFAFLDRLLHGRRHFVRLAVPVGDLPALVADVELTHPAIAIPIDPRYRTVRALIRVHGRPVGYADIAAGHDRMLGRTEPKQAEEVAPLPDVHYEVGQQVRVKSGAFANFTGEVEEVNTDKRKIKLSVSIFGRPTRVEVDFSEVEPASTGA